MKIYKLILSLGVGSLLVLPFATISCSRYSVQKHNEIVAVLKHYANNNKYLVNVQLPKQIKIPSKAEPISMTYSLEQLAGVITWSTKIGDVNYSDTLGGWKQYPTINVLNPTGWGTLPDPSGFSSQLQLVLLSNSYTVEQNINVDSLKTMSKIKISTGFTSIFQNIIGKKVVDKWVTPGTTIKPSITQVKAITTAKDKISPALPSSPSIDDWFKQFNINNVSGMFSITNVSKPGVNTALLNYSLIPYKSNIKIKQQYLIDWVNNDKADFVAMFSYFHNFEFSDLITSINNTK